RPVGHEPGREPGAGAGRHRHVARGGRNGGILGRRATLVRDRGGGHRDALHVCRRLDGRSVMNKALPFLMFNNNLDAALKLYAEIFPGTTVDARSGQSAELTVFGQRFMAFDGGPHFKFSDAFSVFVRCEDQKEVDTYWNALLKAGSKPTMCG